MIPFARSLALVAVKGRATLAASPVLEALPEFRAVNTRTVLLTSGQDESSRMIVLPFGESGGNPLAAVKIAADPRFGEMTRLEFVNLCALGRSLTRPLRDTVPEPLSLGESGGNVIAVQSYIRGQSLWVSTGRWHLTTRQAREDLKLAANWLTRFHRQVQFEPIMWDQAASDQWLEARWQAYDEIFRATPDETRLWRCAHERSRALAGQTLPAVWQHNDFGLWNLYSYQNDLAVIDWESSCPGLPVCDLVYLVTHWAFIARRYHTPADEERGISQLFIEKSRVRSYARFARDVMSDYLAELKIDAGFLPLLLVYLWVDRAVDRVYRQQRLENPLAKSRSGNRFVSYLGVLATQADRVFERAA